MSWRRFSVVLRHLPRESAFKTALWESMTPQERAALPKPDGSGSWSHLELLAATQVDLLRHLLWQNSDGKSPAPEPTPRPGVEGRKVVAISPEAEAYWRAYWREVERLHGASPAPDWTPDPSELEVERV